MEKFFTINDDFENIIKQTIAKQITDIKKIVNGWTNFVFQVEDIDNDTYFFRFPRNDIFSDALVKERKKFL